MEDIKHNLRRSLHWVLSLNDRKSGGIYSPIWGLKILSSIEVSKEKSPKKQIDYHLDLFL